jgi:hypothetical protein
MPHPLQLSGRARRAPGPLWAKSGKVDLRRGTVEIGRGVRMSCQELGDDVAVIRFLCPPARPRKRRATPKT